MSRIPTPTSSYAAQPTCWFTGAVIRVCECGANQWPPSPELKICTDGINEWAYCPTCKKTWNVRTMKEMDAE